MVNIKEIRCSLPLSQKGLKCSICKGMDKQNRLQSWILDNDCRCELTQTVFQYEKIFENNILNISRVGTNHTHNLNWTNIRANKYTPISPGEPTLGRPDLRCDYHLTGPYKALCAMYVGYELLTCAMNPVSYVKKYRFQVHINSSHHGR